jgi:LPXTG-motif cell wall-anchored protein
MLRKTALAITAFAILAVPSGARAVDDVTVEELTADAPSFEGQVVSVVGELVGDYGFRRDGTAWGQLNGDEYATAPLLEGGNVSGPNVGIGVRAPADVIKDLDPPGDYHHRGPLVRATGTWRYHDADRGGETYLDATTIEVLEHGREFTESADPAVVWAGGLLIGLALWLGYRSRKRSAD